MSIQRSLSVSHLGITSHYVVEGMRFPGARAVHAAAVARGFNGKKTIIEHRLKSGANTWKELAAPVDERKSAAGKKAHLGRKAQYRAEMAALCAELDARKAQRTAA